MSKRDDLTGMRFNRLIVVEFSHKKGRKSYWTCICDCGKYKVVRADSLKDGSTKSCSCLNKENGKVVHGMHGTKLYGVWASMKNRCKNKNDTNYHHYGGRGISYHADWEDFVNFYEWAKSTNYMKGLSIDRIDVDGHYEPSNCTWITMSEQQNNKRNNVLITYKNKTQNIKQWSDELDVTFNLLYGRLHKYDFNMDEVMESLNK